MLRGNRETWCSRRAAQTLLLGAFSAQTSSVSKVVAEVFIAQRVQPELAMVVLVAAAQARLAGVTPTGPPLRRNSRAVPEEVAKEDSTRLQEEVPCE